MLLSLASLALALRFGTAQLAASSYQADLVAGDSERVAAPDSTAPIPRRFTPDTKRPTRIPIDDRGRRVRRANVTRLPDIQLAPRIGPAR